MNISEASATATLLGAIVTLPKSTHRKAAAQHGLCAACYEARHDRESPIVLTDGQWVKDHRGIHIWIEGTTA